MKVYVFTKGAEFAERYVIDSITVSENMINEILDTDEDNEEVYRYVHGYYYDNVYIPPRHCMEEVIMNNGRGEEEKTLVWYNGTRWFQITSDKFKYSPIWWY